MIPTLTLCSLDRFCGMVDVYNYIIRVANNLTFIYLFHTCQMAHDTRILIIVIVTKIINLKTLTTQALSLM